MRAWLQAEHYVVVKVRLETMLNIRLLWKQYNCKFIKRLISLHHIHRGIYFCAKAVRNPVDKFSEIKVDVSWVKINEVNSFKVFSGII